MDAEGYRSAPAVAQDDRGVADGYDSGNQHKPTKRVCGSVSYGNGREQARRNVTNTFREQVPLLVSTYANGINDNGQIVGYYANNGVASGFLYDPAPGPIPGSGLLSYVALAMHGLVSAGWKRWRLRSA